MSDTYVSKVNDKPLAASEAVPSSEIDTKLKGLKDRWNDNHGNMKTSSTTSAVWAKLATVAYPSGLDGENAIYGKIVLHQYTTTKLAADFSFLFPSGALAVCKGNFTSNNIGDIKIGFVIDSTNRTVDLYGYLSGYAYSGIRLIIDDITRYHGATVDAAVQYYKDATLLSSAPSGIVYCNNDNGAVQTNVADYLKYQHTNEINHKNVPTSGNKSRHWFNYRNGDTDVADASNTITDYYFGNRNNSTDDVYLHADGFAPRLISGGNSNVLPFAKFTLTNTGTSKGFVHFRCVFVGTNSGSDSMGQTDILIKIEQNTWYGLATKSVRSGGTSSYSYDDFGNYIYWETGSTVYLGVRPGSYNAYISVLVQYCALNGTATYTLGNYLSEVSSLAIHEGCNRDVSMAYRASQTNNVRAINIENYLKIEIPLRNNHRNASITIFGSNGQYPFIANIGFQFLTSPGSGESAGFQAPPKLSMVECNNNASNSYVPNVWYINNGSSGSSYIYCKWASNKRLTVLLNTFDPQAIVLSDESSLPSEAVAATSAHSMPHMNGIGSAFGNNTTPVYLDAGGQILACYPYFVSNPSDMSSNGSIASEAKDHWTNMPTPDMQMVYNNRGDEYSMIFSRHGNYGNIVRWTYFQPYFEMLRNYNGTWRTTDWEPVMTPCVLTVEYNTDTSQMEALYSKLMAWRTTTLRGSTTATGHPTVFLYKDGAYYMLSSQGASGGQYGGSATWSFTRVVGSSVDRVSFTAAWDNSSNYTYSWGGDSGVANDVSPKHRKSTYYSSNGNQTIDISDNEYQYEVQLNSYASSVTIDLDCSKSFTCTAVVKLVDKITAAQCGGLYIRWHDECGAYHRYLFDHMSSSARDTVGLQVSIKRVTMPVYGSPTYAVARVTLIPGEYSS